MSENIYQLFKKIDHIIESHAINYEVFKLMQSEKICSDYFFKKLKDLDWFNILKENGYFETSTISKDPNGYWNVLPYLEWVSEQVHDSNEYGKELITIINSLVEHSTVEEPIQGFLIWVASAKIVNNIPNQIIDEKFKINDFQKWLQALISPFIGSDVPITDISDKLLPKLLNDDATIKFAEIIIDMITDVRAGGTSNQFSSKATAVLVWQYYWLLEAFKKNNESVGKKCSVETILKIADKLKMTIEYKEKSKTVNINSGEDKYQIMLSRVRDTQLQPREIKFIEGKFNCTISKYLENSDGIDEESQYAFEVKKSKKKGNC